MRILMIFIFTTTVFRCLANDSLNSISLNKKWQLEFIGSYNYNYRKTNGKTSDKFPNRPANERSIINQYIDTGNIACYSKNIGILITRKIWKPFSIQIGLIYGRKGYMYARESLIYPYGTFIDSYIKIIPEKMFVIPLKIKFIFPLYMQLIKIGTAVGCDFNFYTRNKYENQNLYIQNDYLANETNGFFGFTPTKKFPDETKLLHEFYAVPFIQYNLGLNIQLKLYKSLFTSVSYNYISQIKYDNSGEYYYKSILINSNNPQYAVGGFSYQIKPYIHSFGIGLGFEF